MAAHRYWRASALSAYDRGPVVELSEFWLLSGLTRVDAGATLTSSVAPLTGALSSLSDNDLSTAVQLSRGTVLVWDLGVATDVTNIRLGASGDPARFLAACQIEWSDDGVVWRELQLMRNWGGIKWPGVRSLTNSVMRIAPIEQTTIRLSFEPTAWSTNEFGPSIVFTAAAGATPNTTTPIQGSRSIQFSGTGRLSASNFVFPYAAGVDFTVQARIRLTTDAASTNPVIAAFGDINGVTSYVILSLAGEAGAKFLSGIVTGGGSTRFVSSPVGTTWLNTNHHVAFSSENGTLRLFIDGVMVASNTGANVLTGQSSPVIAIGNFGGSASNTFTGLIDEVGIDQKALYFGDFTPPASIVPQAEWLVDAFTFLPALQQLMVVPTQGAMPAFPGVGLKALQLRARPNYLFDPLARGRVRGNVLLFSGITNVPVSRRVCLIRERDMSMVMQQWSDRATGVYDFQYVEEGEAYTVIAHDYTHDKRAVIADGLTLANGKVELMP